MTLQQSAEQKLDLKHLPSAFISRAIETVSCDEAVGLPTAMLFPVVIFGSAIYYGGNVLYPVKPHLKLRMAWSGDSPPEIKWFVPKGLIGVNTYMREGFLYWDLF